MTISDGHFGPEEWPEWMDVTSDPLSVTRPGGQPGGGWPRETGERKTSVN